MLEKYNPDSYTFFTQSEKWGLPCTRGVKSPAYLWGPYEDYIPGMKELHLMKKDAPQVYETYWEVLCHFHICAQTTRLRAREVIEVN